MFVLQLSDERFLTPLGGTCEDPKLAGRFESVDKAVEHMNMMNRETRRGLRIRRLVIKAVNPRFITGDEDVPKGHVRFVAAHDVGYDNKTGRPFLFQGSALRMLLCENSIPVLVDLEYSVEEIK